MQPAHTNANATWLYPRSTTLELLDDLRDGKGKPPPVKTPRNYFAIKGHRWIGEGTDLSRVAMHELSQRDELGLLVPADQRNIDRLVTLADLTSPIKSPGQVCIRQYLDTRWLKGKLSLKNSRREIKQ